MADDPAASSTGHRPLSSNSQRPQNRSGVFSPNSFASADDFSHPGPRVRRRSSLQSLASAQESLRGSADDLWSPKPYDDDDDFGRGGRRSQNGNSKDEVSGWHSLPLAFALLPAVAGLIMKDGAQVVTDILLLGLASVFLNWSVRLPW
jgi:hypothetical protein